MLQNINIQVHYDRYNKRFGKDGFHESLTWEDQAQNVEDFKEKVRILVLHWDSLMLAPYISVKCNTVGIKMFKELLELKMFGIRNAAFDVQNVHSPTSCTPLTHKTFALLTYLHKWMREKITCKLPLAYDPVEFLIQKCIVYVDKNIIKAI